MFSALKPGTFTNSFNFANLINQSAGVIVIAMGLVFVLLLGEIDLSAGFTAGTAAAMTGIAADPARLATGAPAILVGVATGAFIGPCIGLLVARLGIPSFVVTLATFLGLQGVMLLLIGEGGDDPDPRRDARGRDEQEPARLAGLGASTRPGGRPYAAALVPPGLDPPGGRAARRPDRRVGDQDVADRDPARRGDCTSASSAAATRR